LIPARFRSKWQLQYESGATPAENKMVEQLNRQRVLNMLDTFYSGDIEGALARCSDDIDYIASAPIDILPHMGHRRGKAEVREMWQTVHARYSSLRHEVAAIVAEGDRVAVHIRAFFTKRSNDRIVQFDLAVFYLFRDGLIVQMREILDTFDLVQQVLERDVAAVLAGQTPDAV
jgi:ketosteroid isomerase-like protein